MAITGNSSYIPTINDFLAHWTVVNNTLPASLSLVVDNLEVDRLILEERRIDLETSQDTVQDKLNDLEIARTQIFLDKTKLLAWLNEFNGLVDSYYNGTKFENARPKAPGIGDGQDGFLRPLKDAKSLWTKLNAAPARPGLALPLKLSDNTAQAGFASAITEMQTHYDDIAEAEMALSLARKERDLLHAAAYEIMKQYRASIPPRCASFPALLTTLPRLTPERGSTPDALTATIEVLPNGQIKVTHSAVTQQGIQRVALRGNVGANYQDDDAVTLADHTPGAAPEFVLPFFANVPSGGSMAFKVYVINTTDNEAGSETVVATRP